jgi:hypothetical protein
MPMSAGEIAFTNSLNQIDKLDDLEKRMEKQSIKIQELLQVINESTIDELAQRLRIG